METRASKTAADPETPSPAASHSEDLSQITKGPFSTSKIESSETQIKSELRSLMLSDEEMAAVMAMRNPPSTPSPSLPPRSSVHEDVQTDVKVSFTTLEPPTPPLSNSPTAVTAISTPSISTTGVHAVKLYTPKYDLSDLAKNPFTLSSTLNKPRWEKLIRILKSNGLYTLAINERVPPYPTLTNIRGYTPETFGLHGPPYAHVPADDVPTYVHDTFRLQAIMHAAFDKALYHQSQGFLNDDPVLMYKDLRNYFYGRDNNGIKSARLHLEKYRINPANSLKADITLFEEAITNLEYASGETITENIRLSYVDEKFGQDARLGVRERLTHCQCNYFTYTDTMTALKNTPNASVTPHNHSRMNTLQPIKSKDLCNNFLKGRCTYGEKCKYVHGKTPITPTPLKAIADVFAKVPPTGRSTKTPKSHARPNYISEAHRIKIGALTGKVTDANPLGISHKQEVILKYLQSRDNDWDIRGGRDSNGNEYAMNMMRITNDNTSNEPPTPEAITYESDLDDGETDTIRHARWAAEEEETYRLSKNHQTYSPEDDESRGNGPYSFMSYTNPTPPRLPRTAPYVLPARRSTGYNGFTYEFLDEDYVLPERPPVPSSQPTASSVSESNPVTDATPIKKLTRPTKLRITEDRTNFITSTVLVYHHCLPDNSVVPKSLEGFISYVYDKRPTASLLNATTASEKGRVKMSVNIFGWSPVNLLMHNEVASLYIYLGDPHLLELLNVLGNVFLHASTVPHYAHTPLVEGSYNSFSPFAKKFNHVTFEGSYQSSVINIFSYGFYYKCICKLNKLDDIRAYLMLTIIYDFMAFVSKYYRFRLGAREPSEFRMTIYRDELLGCISDFSTEIQIDPENAHEFIAMIAIFEAIIKNASPIPRLPADGALVTFFTPPAIRKRPLSPHTFQSPSDHSTTKRPRLSEGHDEASDDEEEAELLFSPATRARPTSAIIDLSQPVYPTLLSPSKLNDVTDIDINLFTTISLNAMRTKETTIIMDSGAGRTGTSDMSLLRNVQPSHTTTVTGAFGPAIKPSHTGTFGPHNLDAVYIKSMGPQTLVSLSQYCNAGNKFIGIFTPTEYRMYDASSAMPALKLLSAHGVLAERGTVENGIYVRT